MLVQLVPGAQYKTDSKPAVGRHVTSEQVLIDAGIPAEKRARSKAESD